MCNPLQSSTWLKIKTKHTLITCQLVERLVCDESASNAISVGDHCQLSMFLNIGAYIEVSSSYLFYKMSHCQLT